MWMLILIELKTFELNKTSGTNSLQIGFQVQPMNLKRKGEDFNNDFTRSTINLPLFWIKEIKYLQVQQLDNLSLYMT